jgi:Putative Ig domain
MLIKYFATGLVILTVAVSCRSAAAQNAPAAAPLAIQPETLPEATQQEQYYANLRATGGVPPLHWALIRGELPAGLELQDNGVITGVPKSSGEFRFSAEVTDSSQPPNLLHRQFTIIVVTPLTLDWSHFPVVNNDRIEGVLKITNGTKDTFDLTVIVVAVNETGKAFALGYQRLDFNAGTADFQVPFSSTLPQGAYVVHADAVAEVPAHNAIFRRRLQTPSALQITAGP